MADRRTNKPVNSAARIIKIVIINLVLVALLLFLIEGAASYLITAKRIVQSEPVPERVHTEYDADLGWVNLPDTHISDMYGPGVYLETNTQRFRNRGVFSREIPHGRTRIICSGDSFTMGVGVDNDHTWCELLAALTDSLDSVNMGQGGYGLDQAYLWHKRDGAEFERDVHLVAFITDDFWRMYRDSFEGYGKPLLVPVGDSLELRNVPVPRASYRIPWIPRIRPVLSRLDTVKLLEDLVRRVGAVFRTHDEGQRGEEVREVVSMIFADLKATNEARGGRLVLVYLPAFEDYMGVDDTEQWRRFVQNVATEQDILYLDIVEEMRKLPPPQIREIFGPHAHYSEAGNAFVAGAIHARLTEILARSSEQGRHSLNGR